MQTIDLQPLDDAELAAIDAYWRAANYLSVGQIYLLDNPLLREPLRARARQAPAARPLGHDARPELRLRPPEPGHPPADDLDVIYIMRARATAARAWWPTPGSRAPTARSTRTISQDERGHAPAVPAVLLPRRHPEPRRARDARARSTRAASSATRCPTPTAPPSTTPTWSWRASSATARPRPARWPPSWHSNKFLDPSRDGAVLPILHLNGYKIANPTVLARIGRRRAGAAAGGLRLQPYLVEGDEPAAMHQADGGDPRRASTRSRDIQRAARAGGGRPSGPAGR